MKTSEMIEIIAAAEEKGTRAKVKGVAYSGAKMRLGGWFHPVVVDVDAMEVPDEVPILANHENHTSARIGVAKVRKVDGRLELDGEIVATGELADTIVNQAKAGAKWQVSIGAEVTDATFVKAGKITVNGREHEGPVNHVTKATLREVSVVAVGADKETSLAIAAAFSPVGASIPDPAPDVSADWEARYKGASKKINELQAACAAHAEETKSLQGQLDEARTALAAANAEREQLKAKVDEGAKALEASGKDLADARDSLAKAESEVAHLKETRRLLTAGVLTPQAASFDDRLKAARSPEEREAIRAEMHKAAV